MLALAAGDPAEAPPILKTVALTGEGVPELMEEVERRRSGAIDSEARRRRERRRSRERFLNLLREELLSRARRTCLDNGAMEELVEDLADRRRDPYTAAEAVLDKIRFPAPRRAAMLGSRRR
jgi:LAO/AO transport system kinase